MMPIKPQKCDRATELETNLRSFASYPFHQAYEYLDYLCVCSLQECPFEVGEILRSRETTKRIPGKQDIVQILPSFC